MANQVTFDYAQMDAAANQIRNTHAQAYGTAAQNFRQAMDTAIAGWTGASKDQFVSLLTTRIYPYLETNVVEMVTALADVLQDNSRCMASVDTQIAAQIAQASA